MHVIGVCEARVCHTTPAHTNINGSGESSPLSDNMTAFEPFLSKGNFCFFQRTKGGQQGSRERRSCGTDMAVR